MEGCVSTVQVTPPMEESSAFTEHILWAPKKKRLHRRVISANLPSGDGARAHSHSKIRKRLIFPCPEESERKAKEEVSSNSPEDKEKSNNVEKNSARTPDSSGDKQNGSSLHLLKATNVRVEQFKTNQKGVRNVDPQRIKRKLALSSFRWRKKNTLKNWTLKDIGIQLSKFATLTRSLTLRYFESYKILEANNLRKKRSESVYQYLLICIQFKLFQTARQMQNLWLFMWAGLAHWKMQCFICRILYIYAALLARNGNLKAK